MKFCALILTLSVICFGAADPVDNRTFPENFKFGVATASYQIEGGWKDDGKGENIWDRMCHTKPETIKNQDNGDIACDSYHKYEEDVQMLKDLGVNFYRFSLSWSRILPTGYANKINAPGVLYYKNLINALKENGIEPMITLYHWDLPQPLQDIGGWPNPLLAELFGDFARVAFDLFGDDVKTWLTFNEAKQTCQMGYGSGGMAPNILSSGIGEYLCTHTVLKAHALAYHIYDEEFRPKQGGRISIVIDTSWYEPASDKPEDIEAAERRMQFNFGWYAHPIYVGNYPQIMIDRIANRSKLEGFPESRLPSFTEEELEYIKGTSDYFSLNTYTTELAINTEEAEIGEPSWSKDFGVVTYQDPEWESTASSWLKVVPWGMRKLLVWIKENYNNPEIIITENGVSDDGSSLNDTIRINYYRDYLSNVLTAIHDDQVNVTGYTAWSLMDNFEWGNGYTEKFGLYSVDFNSPNRERTPKESTKYYKKVVETKCLIDECV